MMMSFTLRFKAMVFYVIRSELWLAHCLKSVEESFLLIAYKSFWIMVIVGEEGEQHPHKGFG